MFYCSVVVDSAETDMSQGNPFAGPLVELNCGPLQAGRRRLPSLERDGPVMLPPAALRCNASGYDGNHESSRI